MSLDLPTPQAFRITKTGMVRLVLMLFTWLILVGGSPLSAQFGEIAEDAQGLVRTTTFLAGFLIVVTLAGGRIFRAVPGTLMALIGWCAVTLSWAIDPQIALARLGLGVVVTLTILLSIDMLGARQALRAVALVVTVIVWADIAAVLLFDGARHMVGERDADLVGLWRGLHGHKNIAGSVAGLGLLLAFFQSRPGSVRFWLLAPPAAILLLGSGSRTAIAVLGAALAVTLLVDMVRRNHRGRSIMVMLVLVMLVIATLLVLSRVETIVGFLDDPRNLTGRTALWQILIDYWRANPWGSGFESFWRIGEASPALGYVRSAGSFALVAPHGHNGYLDMLASTGIVGLILTLVAVLVSPLRLFLSAGGKGYAVLGLVLVLFFVFHNGLESSVLKGARVGWFVFCLGLGVLMAREKRP